MPRAVDASSWPGSTERMPARTISAMYAASLSESPITASQNTSMTALVSKRDPRRGERDADVDRRVDGGDEAPEHELHVHRGAAEDPEVQPGDALDHGVVREPHDGEGDAEDDRDHHRVDGQQQGVERRLRDALVEEVLAEVVPAVGLALGRVDEEEGERRDEDDGEDDAPRVPQPDGLDRFGSPSPSGDAVVRVAGRSLSVEVTSTSPWRRR